MLHTGLTVRSETRHQEQVRLCEVMIFLHIRDERNDDNDNDNNNNNNNNNNNSVQFR
jgi:hypothetical protein